MTNNNSQDRHYDQKGVNILFPKGYKEPYYAMIKDITGMNATTFIKEAINDILNLYDLTPTASYSPESSCSFDLLVLDNKSSINELHIIDNEPSKKQHLINYFHLLLQNNNDQDNFSKFLSQCDGTTTLDEIKKKYLYHIINEQKKEKYDVVKVWLPTREKMRLDNFCSENNISLSKALIKAAQYKLKKDYGIDHDSERFPF